MAALSFCGKPPSNPEDRDPGGRPFGGGFSPIAWRCLARSAHFSATRTSQQRALMRTVLYCATVRDPLGRSGGIPAGATVDDRTSCLSGPPARESPEQIALFPSWPATVRA